MHYLNNLNNLNWSSDRTVCGRTEGAGRSDGWGVYVTVYHYHL